MISLIRNYIKQTRKRPATGIELIGAYIENTGEKNPFEDENWIEVKGEGRVKQTPIDIESLNISSSRPDPPSFALSIHHTAHSFSTRVSRTADISFIPKDMDILEYFNYLTDYYICELTLCGPIFGEKEGFAGQLVDYSFGDNTINMEIVIERFISN